MNKALYLIITPNGECNTNTQLYVKSIKKMAKELDVSVYPIRVSTQNEMDIICKNLSQYANLPTLILEPCEFKKPETYNNAEKNCTAKIITDYCTEWFDDRESVLIINRSNLIGKPLINLLLDEDFTVTVAHSKTSKEQLKKLVKVNNIIIVATGQSIDVDLTNKIVFDVGGNCEYQSDKCISYTGMRTIGGLTTKYMLNNL